MKSIIERFHVKIGERVNRLMNIGEYKVSDYVAIYAVSVLLGIAILGINDLLMFSVFILTAIIMWCASLIGSWRKREWSVHVLANIWGGVLLVIGAYALYQFSVWAYIPLAVVSIILMEVYYWKCDLKPKAPDDRPHGEGYWKYAWDHHYKRELKEEISSFVWRLKFTSLGKAVGDILIPLGFIVVAYKTLKFDWKAVAVSAYNTILGILKAVSTVPHKIVSGFERIVDALKVLFAFLEPAFPAIKLALEIILALALTIVILKYWYRFNRRKFEAWEKERIDNMEKMIKKEKEKEARAEKAKKKKEKGKQKNKKKEE